MLAFLWFFLLVLASRLVLITRDGPLGRRQALGLALAQCASLLVAAPGIPLLALGGLIVATNLIGAGVERRRRPAPCPGCRLVVLLSILVGAGFVFAPAQAIPLNPLLLGATTWLGRHFLFCDPAAMGAGEHGAPLPTVLIGALLVMNEANLLIRVVLQRIRVVPHPRSGDNERAGRGEMELILPARGRDLPSQRIDLREYNAGRYIGVVERLLVYVFVLQGQYAAIGLVLAAKGFARFREMDQREFAEYVLIGTLLSMACAVLVAEAVKIVPP
jgi:hypothetical protein